MSVPLVGPQLEEESTGPHCGQRRKKVTASSSRQAYIPTMAQQEQQVMRRWDERPDIVLPRTSILIVC